MSIKKSATTSKSAKTAPATSLRLQDPHLERERERYENPLPSREYVLQVLEEAGAPLYAEDLARLLSITEEERAFFERRLGAMARDGQLMVNRKGALCIAEKIDLIPGRVQGHAEGFGFLVPDDGSDDLYLSSRELDKVMHGDRVLVRQAGFDRRGRREGRIVEVLERLTTRLVGRFMAEHGVYRVVAEDKRIAKDILVPPKEKGKAKPGQVVMVEITQQPDHKVQPLGRVVEILGNYDDPGMEIEIALRKHNLPYEFSAEAKAQAEATPKTVGKKDLKPVMGVKRVDLRDLPLVTIDGETARDFDDAVYAEKKGKGWRLVVAIADVSHYVQPGDALDVTSIERGNSVYFPRRVIPMLPEELSNGLCSLNPAVDRLCMVCDMQVSASGSIKKYKFYPAVMHSKARLTYTKVWDMLEEPKGKTAKEYKKVLPHIQDLYALYQAFAAARVVRGAIDFETTETEVRFDDKGKISQIVPVIRNPAHKLIEECMLAANVCAADFLITNKQTCLYRVHEGPNPERLEKLREYLRSCGLSLGGGEEPKAGDYATLLEEIKTRPDASLLQTMLLRSLQQAVYSPDNKGHFGLGYEAYTHFTSPIRRYPDLLVHRAIKSVLAGKKYRPAQKWEALGIQCSMTERRADEASRDVMNFLKCYFMQDKVGEVFEGSVSAVTGFGMFVLLDNLYVEGLVHVSELGNDYFHYDDLRHELKGERSGRIYKLTDRVKVKVARVALDTSKIDFVLVPEEKAKVVAPIAEAPAAVASAPESVSAAEPARRAPKTRSQRRRAAAVARKAAAAATPAPVNAANSGAQLAVAAAAQAKKASRSQPKAKAPVAPQPAAKPTDNTAAKPAANARKPAAAKPVAPTATPAKRARKPVAANANPAATPVPQPAPAGKPATKPATTKPTAPKTAKPVAPTPAVAKAPARGKAAPATVPTTAPAQKPAARRRGGPTASALTSAPGAPVAAPAPVVAPAPASTSRRKPAQTAALLQAPATEAAPAKPAARSRRKKPDQQG
ncbi:ribonuclease R [Silvimonas terrae]|uniref:Ribonuclease R n=1 Tax=Silvimonas terrae TaxID=300266 RepID=A0A840RKA2_9NEIS|nr:ribonuclease R [Silvimonas terrae]MBB5193567.1 ribonuclease R [Silvimonas terrae]